MDAIATRPGPGDRFQREKLPTLRVLRASPRGFCAGVVRAIETVEAALRERGAPVYVRRPIVHNMAVVRSLEGKGAIFIEELDAAPAGATVVLSAHGVPRSVVADGEGRGLRLVNAICPLVAKVHRELHHHFAEGRHIILIGHPGHPEITGSLGQLPEGAISLVSDVTDAARLMLEPGVKLAYAIQTTFSVEEAEVIVSLLEARFGPIAGPSSTDICYATSNRQEAVRLIASRADAFIIAGEHFSSNANRLAEAARAAGCRSQLVASAEDIDWSQLADVRVLGLSSAASTPEPVIAAVVDALMERFEVDLVDIVTTTERIAFKPVDL